ncbi:MAG: aminotransferase class I/II-fold pyridoxal phosphate-dependent enzyme [Planctomycetes bacterium]|nr:aminotransferase class I/II-fold pyridoxal phosphate-dependent enzyme [Planctomycetota bacterium]
MTKDLFDKCAAYTRHIEAHEMGLYPYFIPLSSSTGPEVIVKGKKMIMAGSNNYLGLTQHPYVNEQARKAIEKYGTGCTGSRFLNGTIDLHEELENKLAKFVKKEKCLVFSTGFQTNLGTISALAGKNDIILCDRQNHASIIDGCRLSFGEIAKYKHNDTEDLERVLTKIQDKPDVDGLLLVTDGVFSMTGTIVDLPEIVKLKKKYKFRIMLDDAHGVGVIGKTGRGTTEHFNAWESIDLIMGTFSKTFASLGGFVAGPSVVMDYIQHNARSLIFSAAMPPSAVATVKACLEVMEKDASLVQKLHETAKYMIKGYKQLGFETGNTETAIIPIILGEMELVLRFWKLLFEEGVYVNPILSPAVPEDMCLLRTSYMATHKKEHLDSILQKFEKVGKKLGVI